MAKKSMYEKLGVDPMKKNVRRAFGKLIDNDFPGAWVNIVRDPDHPGEVFTQHMDGDGSKLVQRILIYKETGDESVFTGLVDDGLQMNLGDIAASGFVYGKIVVTDVIDINGFNVPKDLLMAAVARRFQELKALHERFDFNLYFLGGETADLPDQVLSAVFNICVYARAKEEEIVSGQIKAGDAIYGFASDGRAKWEPDEYNFGIMANGLTLARIKTMFHGYSKLYPWLIRQGGSYEGHFDVGQDGYIRGDKRFPINISRALISPTRQWSIFFSHLFRTLRTYGISDQLHGVSFNTGGGATKVMHLGTGGIIYEKKMPDQTPLIFQFIQQESGETWKNMYQAFNCGIGVDVVGEDTLEFKAALEVVAHETGIEMFRLGKCRRSGKKGNSVFLKTRYGSFKYE